MHTASKSGAARSREDAAASSGLDVNPPSFHLFKTSPALPQKYFANRFFLRNIIKLRLPFKVEQLRPASTFVDFRLTTRQR